MANASLQTPAKAVSYLPSGGTTSIFSIQTPAKAISVLTQSGLTSLKYFDQTTAKNAYSDCLITQGGLASIYYEDQSTQKNAYDSCIWYGRTNPRPTTGQLWPRGNR